MPGAGPSSAWAGGWSAAAFPEGPESLAQPAAAVARGAMARCRTAAGTTPCFAPPSGRGPQSFADQPVRRGADDPRRDDFARTMPRYRDGHEMLGPAEAVALDQHGLDGA